MSKATRWARKHDSCIYCDTRRRKHAGKGYCQWCYRIFREIERVQAWEFGTNGINGTVPTRFHTMVFNNRPLFENLKLELVEAWKARADQLERWENMRSDSCPDGWAIEILFANILSLSKKPSDTDVTHGLASIFDGDFSCKQRAALTKVLVDILESIRWGGVDISSVVTQAARATYD